MSKKPIIISIILLIIAIFPISEYGYFQILRWFVCISSGYTAYEIYNYDQNNKWIYIFTPIAILYNPIVPIYFSKDIWTLIDSATAIILFVFLFKKFNKHCND